MIRVFNQYWDIAAQRTSPAVKAAVDRYHRGDWTPVTPEEVRERLPRSA